jgi:hypothetical protein
MIRIPSITITDSKPWPNGDKLLCVFDAEFSGLRLNGCLLIRSSRGGLLAQAPRGDSQRPNVRAIQILDSGVRSQLADAAHNAFRALGGVE